MKRTAINHCDNIHESITFSLSLKVDQDVGRDNEIITGGSSEQKNNIKYVLEVAWVINN